MNMEANAEWLDEQNEALNDLVDAADSFVAQGGGTYSQATFNNKLREKSNPESPSKQVVSIAVIE